MKQTKRARALLCIAAAMTLLASAGCTQVQTVTSEIYEDEEPTATATAEETQAGEQTGEATEAEGTQKVNGPTKSQAKGTTKANKPDGGKTNAPTAKPDGGDNLKGAQVTIASWSAGLEPKKSAAHYKQHVALVSSIEKKYNCKIVYKNDTDDAIQYYGKFQTAAAAGNKYADIVFVPSDLGFPSAGLKGYFQPLDGYVDFKSVQWNQKATNELLPLKGKHYYLAPAIYAHSLAGSGIFFNKTLFQKFGEKTPYDYMKSNQWNWDNFLKVAQAMTRSDGGTQYYGMANIATSSFISSNGVTSSKVVNGKGVFNLDNPAAIEGIQFARDLKTKYKVVPDDGSLWTKGKVAMISAAWYQGIDYLQELGDKNVGFAYQPMGPKVKDYNYFGGSMDLVGIPSAVKNPATIAKILTEYTAMNSWRPTAERALEGYFGDETALNAAVDMVNRAYRNMIILPYYPGFSDTVMRSDFGLKKNMSPQAYVASVKNSSQEAIDAVWAGN